MATPSVCTKLTRAPPLEPRSTEITGICAELACCTTGTMPSALIGLIISRSTFWVRGEGTEVCLVAVPLFWCQLNTTGAPQEPDRKPGVSPHFPDAQSAQAAAALLPRPYRRRAGGRS